MLIVPSERKDLIVFANEIKDACRASVGSRAAYYRSIQNVVESGKIGDGQSLINLLYAHLDRLASHLYSPTELRFSIDFENPYPANITKRADVAAKVLTRDWERNNTDILFGQGVFEGLKFGASILKQWTEQHGDEGHSVAKSSLVMPWQMGAYREDINDLNEQEALCETVSLSMPEVWRRIYHLPDAQRIFADIKANASKGGGDDTYNSFFHSVLSTAQINTGNTGMTRPTPGGIVELNADPSRMNIGPQIDVPMVLMHELWVKDEDDYTTIQLIEPDIIISPRFKKTNLLVPAAGAGDEKSGLQPYRLIQPNQVYGYLWGRSELVDLIQPQGLLSEWADDARRITGLTIDKIMGFAGIDGMTDELYGQMRGAGWVSAPPGASITDLTPQMPPNLLQMMEFMIKVINMIGGFDNILSGQGEPGVRSDAQASTMMKTAAPRLRDRSLLVERQCAAAGDLRMSLMEAKDDRHYWVDGTSEATIAATRFLMAELPDDRRVTVDSHSTSPIFADDHQQTIAFGVKAGFVDGESAIEEMPFPHKDKLKERLKARQEAQAKQLQELKQNDPEEYAKVLEKSAGGGKKR